LRDVAKKKGASLPASYGGLMRYTEAIGRVQLEPGHVVLIVAGVSAVLLLLNILV
jgi:preprotein translocase subunit Sec61beta